MISSILLITAAYIIALWVMRKKSIFWLMPSLITITAPLLIKLELVSGVYLHPSVILISGYFIVLLLGRWSLLKEKLNLLSLNSIRAFLRVDSVSLAVITLIGLFLYGGVVSLMRGNGLDYTEVLRGCLYVSGFSMLWVTRHAWLPSGITPQKLMTWYVWAISTFTLIGVGRIVWFVSQGGRIDYWTYNADQQTLGTLGQYINSDGLHLISSAANENSSWLMSLAVFGSLVLVKDRLMQKSWLAVSVYGTLISLLIAGILFSLSRAGLVFLGTGLVIMIYSLLGNWRSRILAGCLVALIALSIVRLFPQAPFVVKSLGTLRISQVKTPVAQVEPSQTSPSATEKDRATRGYIEETELHLEPSAAGRVTYWKNSLKIYTDSWANLIFGVGLLSLEDNYNLVTHSMLLQQMVKFGLLGFISFWGLWGTVLWGLIKLWRRQLKEAQLNWLVLPLLAITPGWLLSNLIFGASFFSIELLVVYFGLLGSLNGYLHGKIAA